MATLLLPAAGAPVISEFMASNSATLSDEDGDFPDWIEIFNPDAQAVDLAGWHLTDDAAQPQKWTFPSVSIPSGGYLVVFASDKNRAASGQPLHTNFKLKSGGEHLALVYPDGVTVATGFSPYPAQQTDVSFGIPQGTEVVQTAVDTGAALRFLVPTGAVPGWQSNGFDDAVWSTGTTGIGYERGSGYDPYLSTDIESAIYGNNRTAYLRIAFHLADPSQVTGLRFLAKFDDGFAAYLNGGFIGSSNAPASLSWNSGSNSSVEADLANYQSWDASALIPNLIAGNNTLAIQLLNQSTTSSDLLMLPKLEITTAVESAGGQYDYFTAPTPGEPNNTPPGEPSGPVTLSEPSGVKTGPVSVTMSTPAAGAEIRFTLDGSVPTESSSLYTMPLALADPARLRAKAFESGKLGGPTAVADYAFLDASLLGYLADVPVIVMDNFGAGAYPNKGRSNDGHDVQQVPRQANVVSIFGTAQNSQPFSQAAALQARSGCRVRGSSSSTFPRKPLSVEFWDEADDDLSLSPLGMPAEADWVLNAPNPTYDRSLLHNPVTFGFAKMIGALAPESKVVVVFQNKDGGKVTSSDLAGVYVLMEKVERNRMGMDFKKMDDTGTSGGWMVNIDRMAAIPVGMPASTVQPNFHAAGPNGTLEIPDDEQNSGGSQSADDISEFYHSYLNFASPDGYGILQPQRARVQADVRAMDAAVWAGDFDDPVTGYAAHLDADSWARFYAVQNFAKNNDAIVLSTYLYKAKPTAKIRMGPVWDFDRAYTWNGSATSSPLAYSNYDWYEGLFQDINFKQLHQDAWQTARATSASDGALMALVDSAAAGLRPDQISASGISHSTWQSRVNAMKSWIVDRANYLDSQYEPMPSVTPETELFSGSIQVGMAASNGGTVYFTTDGTDPRAPGGAVAASAGVYTAPFTVAARTRVIARTKDGARWSAPVERNYYRQADVPQLVVSEIDYHPADPTPGEVAQGHDDADDFEYIEIMNTGSAAVDLTSLELAGGTSYGFSTSSVSTLAPGARVLVVRDLAAFEARYGSGLPVAGQYQGALNNAGDRIVLREFLLGITLQDFTYSDDAPWPLCADGGGYSLVLKRPETNPDHSLAASWRCSATVGGSPAGSDAVEAFAGNPTGDLDGDGVLALVEHFLGTSDTDSGAGNGRLSTGTATLPADGKTYPTFAVRYRVGADDVDVQALWSENLSSWSDLPADIVLFSHTQHGDGTATLVWRTTRPVGTGSQFFRLRVTQR